MVCRVKVIFLGHRMSVEGVQPDSNKIAAVQTIKPSYEYYKGGSVFLRADRILPIY